MRNGPSKDIQFGRIGMVLPVTREVLSGLERASRLAKILVVFPRHLIVMNNTVTRAGRQWSVVDGRGHTT
jgi:hypothetical protein